MKVQLENSHIAILFRISPQTVKSVNLLSHPAFSDVPSVVNDPSPSTKKSVIGTERQYFSAKHTIKSPNNLPLTVPIMLAPFTQCKHRLYEMNLP